MTTNKVHTQNDLNTAEWARKVFAWEMSRLLGCEVTVQMSIYDHVEPEKSKEIFNLAVLNGITVHTAEDCPHQWAYVSPDFVVFDKKEKADEGDDTNKAISVESNS